LLVGPCGAGKTTLFLQVDLSAIKYDGVSEY